MESYLMMLYVTLEQESALKNFFVDQGWRFCKPDLSVTTDKVGPSVTTPVVPLKDKADANDTIADQNKQSSRFVVKEPESIPKTDSPQTRNKGKRKTESPQATATNVKQPKVLLPQSTVTVPKSSETLSSKTEVVDKPLSSSSNLTPITVLGEDGKHFTIKIEQDADDLQENVVQAESRHDGVCANSSDNVMCNDNNSFYDGGDDNFHDDGDDINDESTDMDYSNDGALGNTSVNTENQLSAGDSMGSASLKGSTKSKGKIRRRKRQFRAKYEKSKIVDAYNMVIFGPLMSLTAEELPSFKENGFLVRKAFAAKEEVKEMKEQMAKLLDGWNPEDSVDSVFSTERDQHINNEYFTGSADHIRFFLEPGAVNENGKIRSDIPKAELVNKVGHSLHVDDPVFRKYSTSRKVSEMVRDLGYKDPVLPQSMYIFKQPLIGGAVTSHQDSSFLHTTPRQTCLGMWLALDPATLENGCLWVRPGSHREPLRRVFARSTEEGSPHFVDVNMDIKASPAVAWEGELPASEGEGLRAKGFIPVEVDAGDLVVFPGTIDHLSLPNTSPKQRHTYQLHLVEGPAAGITWSKENWLQYPAGKPFPSLRA